jgi:hypothetical protein
MYYRPSHGCSLVYSLVVRYLTLGHEWGYYSNLCAEVYHGMGEHYVLIPAAIYKTQMLVSSPPYQIHRRQLST